MMSIMMFMAMMMKMTVTLMMATIVATMMTMMMTMTMTTVVATMMATVMTMTTVVAGEVDTSVDQLLSLKPSSQLPLVNPRKKGKQPRYKVLNFDDMCFNEHIKDSGKLIVHFCYLDLQPSFLDFVQVRITFTFHFHFSVLLFNTFTF